MKTPKLSHTPSYINESSLGVGMEDLPKRDPRVDPLPGDVIQKARHMTDWGTRTVVEYRHSIPDMVKFIDRRSNRSKDRESTVSLYAWRRWARDAEVQDAPQ